MWAWSGVCYRSAESAAQAVASSVGGLHGSSFITPVGVPAVSGSGVLGYSLAVDRLDGSAVQVVTGTAQLVPCEVDLMDQYPVQSVLYVLAAVALFFFGLRTGLRP